MGDNKTATRKPRRQELLNSKASPDYYGRLLEQQPKPMSADETRRFWEEERSEEPVRP
jgi:hypothetical protein